MPIVGQQAELRQCARGKHKYTGWWRGGYHKTPQRTGPERWAPWICIRCGRALKRRTRVWSQPRKPPGELTRSEY